MSKGKKERWCDGGRKHEGANEVLDTVSPISVLKLCAVVQRPHGVIIVSDILCNPK